MDKRIAAILISVPLGWMGWKYYSLNNQLKDANKFLAAVSAGPTIRFNWTNEPVESPVLAETLLHGAPVNYYDIQGNTWQELSQSIDDYRAAHSGREAATFYQLFWQPGDTSDGVCGALKGSVRMELSALMPRWNAGPEATDDAKRFFSLINRELASHEQGHIDIALAAIEPATADMRQSTCTSAEQMLATIRQQLHDQQKDYDFHHHSKGE